MASKMMTSPFELHITDPLRFEFNGYPTAGWDSGFRLTKFALFDGGDEVAYLKVSNIPEKEWHICNPTLYHFAYNFRGWALPLSQGNTRKFQQGVCQYMRAPYRADISVEEALEQLKGHRAYRRLEEEYHHTKALYVGHPFIDYSKTLLGYQRQGLATLLYVEAAHYFNDLGMELRASGTQSDSAQSLWASFKQRGWTQEVEIPGHGSNPRICLNPSVVPRPEFDQCLLAG